MGLIDSNLITEAFVTMYTASSEEDGFPVCELKLKGIGSRLEADVVIVTISLAGKCVKKKEVPITSGESRNFLVKVPSESIPSTLDGRVDCSVSVKDKYGRNLVSASSVIQFNVPNKQPVIDSSIIFPESIVIDEGDIRSRVADLTLTSDSTIPVCIETHTENKVLWQSNVNLEKGIPFSSSVMIDSVNLNDPEEKICIRVKYNGQTILEKKSSVRIARITEKEVQPAVDVRGDMSVLEYVDTHTVSDDKVTVGSLFLLNLGEETDVMASVVLDGSDLLCERIHLEDGEAELDISAPFSRLAREDTHACEIIAHVTDGFGNILVHKVSTVKIRSKYDMDLTEKCLRSAQFVNPRDEVVKNLINNSYSPLASSMSGKYVIQGYQNKGEDILRQMEAVYHMMYDMNMRYVSDTFTYNKSVECYQHVRTPGKVLADKSGNCLELSILYASFMEAMCLEPVLVFPPGHAIAGVVLYTDLYNSASVDVEPFEVPFVHMKINGREAIVLFVETTLCPNTNDFFDAVEHAKFTIEKNLDYIYRTEGYVFIKQMRLNGVDPLLGM